MSDEVRSDEEEAEVEGHGFAGGNAGDPVEGHAGAVDEEEPDVEAHVLGNIDGNIDSNVDGNID